MSTQIYGSFNKTEGYLNNKNIALLNTLTTIWLDKIYRYEKNSRIDCTIKIEEILFSSKGCSMEIMNVCIKNKELAVKLMLDSLDELLKKVNSKEKKIIHKELGLHPNDLNTRFTTGVIQQCKTYASSVNTIDIGKLILPSCINTSSKPLVLTILNTGSVESNCLHSSIRDAFSKLNNIVEDEPIKNMYGFGIDFVIKFIKILLFICIIILIVLFVSHLEIWTIFYFDREN